MTLHFCIVICPFFLKAVCPTYTFEESISMLDVKYRNTFRLSHSPAFTPWDLSLLLLQNDGKTTFSFFLCFQLYFWLLLYLFLTSDKLLVVSVIWPHCSLPYISKLYLSVWVPCHLAPSTWFQLIKKSLIFLYTKFQRDRCMKVGVLSFWHA